MRRALLGAAALALLAAAPPAAAHEVLHAVERGGRAVAVHAFFSDGEPLAYCEAQVFSPADPRVPYQKGRTDRNGWVAFVPDVPGKWRVRVVEATGHGVDAEVEVGAIAAQGAPPGAGTVFVLRPLLGIAAIIAVFGLLFVLHRRRGTGA